MADFYHYVKVGVTKSRHHNKRLFIALKMPMKFVKMYKSKHKIKQISQLRQKMTAMLIKGEYIPTCVKAQLFFW
jgi:hypothetical protein